MPAVTSFVHSWSACERHCFSYLQTALGSIEGVNGYTIETMPREMASAEDYYYIWEFSIGGGSMDIQRQSRAEIPGGVWSMDAIFTAICSTDTIAKQVGGTVIGALPATGSDVPNLGRLFATSYPSIQRVTRSLSNKENAGQERVFFKVDISMRVTFDNMEATTI